MCPCHSHGARGDSLNPFDSHSETDLLSIKRICNLFDLFGYMHQRARETGVGII